MKETILSGKGLCKSFGSSTVMDNVDIDIYAGDFTVIMGPSGAGKSTLLYCLSGMDSLTSGQVLFKGQDISRLPEKGMAKLRAREFGFVFQQPHLVSNLTLFENVAVAGYAGKSEKVDRRANELLEQMNVGAAKDRLPNQVSGGEAQRTAIARAMINRPALLFADEPTGALNKSSSQEVMNLLSRLNAQGQSILMVTHDTRAALRGNRLLYLEDGKIVDELELFPYSGDDRAREQKITGWLSEMRW